MLPDTVLMIDHQSLIGLAWVAFGIALGCGLGVVLSKRWPS